MSQSDKSIGEKITTYLIEIIIIILGISISFGLNEWNKQRADKEDYYKYLENLKEDIRIDSLQMVQDRKTYSRIIRGANYLIDFKSEFIENPDSLKKLGEAFNTLNNFVEFLPNNNTFEQLSSTGDFKKFSNKELVKEIIQLYQYDYAFIRMMGEQVKVDSREHLKPYFLNNVYFEDAKTFPKMRTDIPGILKDRLFRNITLSYEGASKSAIRSYNRALDRLVKVYEMIDVELAKK